MGGEVSAAKGLVGIRQLEPLLPHLSQASIHISSFTMKTDRLFPVALIIVALSLVILAPSQAKGPDPDAWKITDIHYPDGRSLSAILRGE